MGFGQNLIRNARADLRKVGVGSAGSTPPAMQTAQQALGMNLATPLGPGTPISPAAGYELTPRTYDYPVGYNINSRPRQWERVAFSTLRQLAEQYDVAQIAITHRIDALRAVDWNIVAAEGFEGDDVSTAIKIAHEIFTSPDREQPFSSWLREYAYDIFSIDAGCLYSIRNRVGQPIGLSVVDGATIAPLLDEWGRRPIPPAEAYVQYVQGVPWNWLTSDDLIYTPFNPVSNSPYGRAPLESVLMNANTDLRFQLFFMQQFTDGNIPAMLASAPESWTPQQIMDFQAAWDALMKGDQTIKSQVKWMPGGGNFHDVNQNAQFNNDMAMWLMRKTAAAYHVTPSSLGFTEDTNRAVGDSQADVDNRVGDLPMLRHLADIFTRWLQTQVGLPVAFQFDTGAEEDDVLQTAQADKIYVEIGAVSVSEIAQRRFGITDTEIVPRFVFTPSLGMVPLSNLFADSAPVDESGAPDSSIVPARQIDQQTIVTQTVPASPPPKPTPVPADQPGATIDQTTGEVLQQDPGNGALALPLQKQAQELAAFSRYVTTRRKRGRWRPFEFESVEKRLAHNLNTAGFGMLRKDAGQCIAAGLAVYATDTGRVLMLQRCLDPADPAGGTWEFPGGCIEPDESVQHAATREWQEEVGQLLPDGQITSQWVSEDGVYEGFVYTIACEASVNLGDRTSVTNPDDPDGDQIEAVAWFDPEGLPTLDSIRPELKAELGLVLTALNPVPGEGDASSHDVTAEQAAHTELVKGVRDMVAKVPQHHYDMAITDWATPGILTALLDLVPLDSVIEKAMQLAPVKKAGTILPDGSPAPVAVTDLTTHVNEQVAVLVRENTTKMTPASLVKAITAAITEGYVAGQHAAGQQVAPIVGTDNVVTPDTVGNINWSTWTPGSVVGHAMAADGGLADLLKERNVAINGIHGTALDTIGNTIAKGILNGDNQRTIRNSLSSTLGTRAAIIAHTETARAMVAGSMRSYTDNGIDRWDMITAGDDKCCDACEAIADNNPHDVGDVDDQPPVHPWCRCAAAPHVDALDDTTDDDTDGGDD